MLIGPSGNMLCTFATYARAISSTVDGKTPSLKTPEAWMGRTVNDVPAMRTSDPKFSTMPKTPWTQKSDCNRSDFEDAVSRAGRWGFEAPLPSRDDVVGRALSLDGSS